MPTEKFFKSKKCRYYVDGGVWVSEDGTVVCYVVKNKDPFFNRPDRINTPRKKKLPDGRLYIENRFKKKIAIDVAVYTCWCAPRPMDGKKYVLNHKDGNPENNHRFNLEYIPYHYEHSLTDSIKILVDDETIEVHKDGTFWQSKKKLPMQDFGYDPDTDRHFYRSPKVFMEVKGRISAQPVDPDILMRKAGYINGDDADMKDPVILHRDYDPLNYSSDNLEFVERNHFHYQEYLSKINDFEKKRKQEIDVEFNNK